MSKFMVVKEAPETLEKGEYVIDRPSFLQQVVLHRAKKPRNGLTGSHYLRMIADSIAQAFDPENMTAYSIKAHKYEGVPFSCDEDIDKIMVNAMTQDCPTVFPKYLEAKIKNRPSGTTLVYYVDSDIRGAIELFHKNGLDYVPVTAESKKKSKQVQE